MKAFINDPMSANFEAANSSLAQHAKAAALFERASHIGGHRTSTFNPCQVVAIIPYACSDLADPEEYNQFISFEDGLNQVIQTLPSFNIVDGPIDTMRQRLVTFTLCQAAVIQLHSAFDDPASIHRCLNAARAVVSVNQRIPNIQAWEYIDSTMGVRGLPER